MLNTIKINATDLRAVSFAAAKNDIRYYLNGVLVEATATQVRLIATNGHMMMVAYQERDDDTTAEAGTQIIIPGDIVSLFAKAKGNIFLEDERGPDEWRAVSNQVKLDVAFKPVDAKFPDYRRVVPATVSGEAGHYNAEYIAAFHKASKALGRKFSPVLAQNGPDKAALVHVDSRVIGVLMPMRADVELLARPAWFEESPEDRARALETEGLTTSDAQAVADAEDVRAAA